MKEEYVRVCPNCGSTDVKRDESVPAAVQFGAPIGMICRSCGFKSPVFLEVNVDDLEKVREQLKKGKVPIEDDEK